MPQPTVVVLAAGASSRLFPFEKDGHKSSLRLQGQSLIARTLQNLKTNGFTDVVVVVSPRDAEGKGLSGTLSQEHEGMDLKFVMQPEPKGMGDAVLQAEPHLHGQFGVVFSTSVTAGDLLAAMLEKQADNVICTIETAEPWLYGIVSVENDQAVGIVEKPTKGTEPSNLKIEGVYLLSSEYLTALKQEPAAEYNFETALNICMQRQPMAILHLEEDLPSLKFPWHLFNFQRHLLAHATSYQAPSAKVAATAIIDDSQGAVIISDSAIVGHAAKIIGPTYIGPNSLIGDFSFVRQSCIESHVQVGANTEVVRSIIMDNSSLHFGYLSDSIVGRDVHIGAGLITANKRLDKDTVKVTVKGDRVDSMREGLGAIIGHRANLGIRVSTMPGTCIGADAQIFPGQILFSNVDHAAVVK